MNFLSNLAKSAAEDSKPKADEPNPSSEPTSTSDLFSSCKIVAEAAQSQLGNAPEKYDKAEVADASANILSAAEQYGKLDETKGIGKYVDQAEDYLRQYGSKPDSPAPVAADSGEPKPAAAAPAEVKEAEKKPEEEGGAGDFLKK